jgi:hypothetical protein
MNSLCRLKTLSSLKYLAAIGLLAIITGPAVADPYPDEFLKFYQMPLNNGLTPYLPGVQSYPPTPVGSGYGTVPSTAIFPGHDELSTAVANGFNAQGQPIAWQGTYMADDFADYAGTPISHVRWWGSYINSPVPTVGGVTKFLISFEHNVPQSISATGQIIPSHPDPFHPDNLHQIVDFEAGLAPPSPGHFTEKVIPTGIGPPSPDGALFEYNAELHLDKWFHEKAATARAADDVYWLKIVALVNPQQGQQFQWGWHNRDWSIPDALAARKPDTPDGAEDVVGFVPSAVPGLTQPVWHFEDDAVQGAIFITPGSSPFMPTVEQPTFFEQDYLPPHDGPSLIGEFSKDLAFELYTRVPEPMSCVLAGLGGLALLAIRRRRP